MRSYFLFCVLLFFSCSKVFAQIDLDAKGLLLKPPPASIKKKKAYTVTITEEAGASTIAMNAMLERIRYADTLITKSKFAIENSLLLDLANNYNYFKNNPVKSDCITKYIDKLRDQYGIYTSQEIVDGLLKLLKASLLPQKPTCDGDECVCTMAAIKLAEIARIEQKLAELDHERVFIRELFCEFSDSDKDKLFKTKTNGLEILFETANTDFLPGNLDYSSVYLAGGKEMILEKGSGLSQRYSALYKTKNKFELNVEAYDRVKSLILKWHNKAAGDALITQPIVQRAQEQINNDATSLASDIRLLNSLRANPPADILIQLQPILGHLIKYDTFWCATSPFTKYLKHWFWASYGNFTLNYLDFTSVTVLEEKYKAILQKEQDVTEQITKLTSIGACLSCREPALDTLKRLQDTLAVKRSVLEKIQAEKKRTKQLIDRNEQRKGIIVETTKLLHQLKLPVEQLTREAVIYHDVNDDWEIKSARKFQLYHKTVLPETFTVYYGILNAGKPEGEFSIAETQEHFNDTSAFIRDLGSAFRALGEGAGPLVKYASFINPFLGSLVGSFPTSQKGSFESADGLPDAEKKRKKDVDDMLKKIDHKLWRIALLKKMIDEYNLAPAPGELDSVKSQQANFYTYGVKAKQFAVPYTNNYVISKDGKAVVNERFSIGRQKSVSIGAGIFFNKASARQEYVDSANVGATIKSTDSKAKYVIGIKIFPFKAFEADGSILPRFPEKRFSFFAGFEITKPLANLYAGLGYDIVPGLQVSAGVHVYRKDYYTILNNQVTDKTTSYKASGLYYGITIDPIVLADVLKNFFN